MKKIKVITTVATWPTALQLQLTGLRKYMKEDFDLIAFIDTPSEPGPYNLWDEKLRNKALEYSNEIGVKTYLVPEEIHLKRKDLFPKTKELSGNNANLRASDTLQYAFMNEVLESDSPIMFMDNDMFPVNYFSWYEKMDNNKIIRSVFHSSKARFSKRFVTYLWSGLLFIDSENMPSKEIWSFDCGKINGIRVDVSGQTYHWLEQIKKLNNLAKVEKIQHLSSLNWAADSIPKFLENELINFIISDARNIDSKFYCEIYDECFIHFRAGSNWMKESKEIVEDRISKFSKAYLLSLE
jgi:hypothetical protein